MGFLKSIFGDYSSRELKSIYPIVDKIEAMADEYKAMTDAVYPCFSKASETVVFPAPV